MGRIGMGRSGLQKVVLTACLASCGLLILQRAQAQPPLQKVANALGHTAPWAAGKLDLRPPQEIQMSKDAASASLTSRLISRPSQPAESTHIMSPMETLAHNFRQEGLPVAKLFQSNESLVHLGLNAKGKPGLWLIHKLH